MVQPELNGGTIFDIQGFSVHDGPGCRTLIFLKGCSIRCAWCSNPEGLHLYREPLYNRQKCIFDDLCVKACSSNAITHHEESLLFDRKKCSNCTTFECIDACCTGALKKGGYHVTLDELFATIQRDRQYWGSIGGVTLTGGEPFLQPEFCEGILKRCYSSYIHTVVETCGNVPWKNIERSLDFLDWIFYDLKQADPVKHRLMTLAGNELILENARKLSEVFKGRLVFRLPLIPGFNDDAASVKELSDFIISTGRKEINILPAHHFGREKYNLVGKTYYTDDFRTPEKEDLQRVQGLFESRGIRCYSGSETPF